MRPWPDDAYARELGDGRYSIAPNVDAIPPSGEVAMLHTVRIEADGDDVRLVEELTGAEHGRRSAPGFLDLVPEERAKVERALLLSAGVAEVHYRAAIDDPQDRERAE